MYRLVSALMATDASENTRLLIAGAGGGREIGALGADAAAMDITAVDPSDENLKSAKQVAENVGASDRITFFSGGIDDLSSELPYDVATSRLVLKSIVFEETAELTTVDPPEPTAAI